MCFIRFFEQFYIFIWNTDSDHFGLFVIEMNIFGKLQSQYEQLWKYIIRPSRTAYAEQSMGPLSFRLQGQEVQRRDFQLTNSRGLTFNASVWVPMLFDKCNCLVYLHGNSGNRTEGMEYLGKLIKQNIALCCFDFSGCGNAEGEFVTLGYYQQQDLRLVVQELKSMDFINYIALWGRSMGAVTSMLYLAKTIDIKAAIFDSPFKSLKTLVEDMAHKNSKIPSFVLAGAIKIISKTVEDKAGFSIYNINPLKYSVPGLYCPAFFIVALEDEIVPPDHTKELFAAYGGQDKTLKLVKGKHNDSRPQDCVNDAVNFLMERFGHDWKDDLKKPKKEFDFFQMEKLQQQERQEHRKEDVNFFQEVQHGQEVQKVEVEQNIKKGDFSLSGLFSIFSRQKKKENKEIPKREPIKDAYQETRAVLGKKIAWQNTKMVADERKQKQEYEERIRKESSQGESTELLAQWVMFVV